MTPWIVGSVVLLVVAVFSVVHRVPPLVRAVPALVAVVVVLGGHLLELVPAAPTTAVRVLAVTAVAAVGVLAGSAVTGAVLTLAVRDGVERGPHGGILVSRADEPAVARRRPEVLRGGAAIGFLERFAVVGAVLVGRLEIVAAVIAVKGLGRFSELDSAEARERFIVGTLTSICWAGLAAGAALGLR